MEINDNFPWMTFLTVVVGLIVVIVGGIVVILNNMTFEQYLDAITKFAFAVGGVAVGRGLAKKPVDRATIINNPPSQ